MDRWQLESPLAQREGADEVLLQALKTDPDQNALLLEARDRIWPGELARVQQLLTAQEGDRGASWWLAAYYGHLSCPEDFPSAWFSKVWAARALYRRSHKMDDALKKRLLERKFQSVEYMEEMRNLLQEAIDSLVAALQQFHANPPRDEERHQWDKADWPDTWEERVLKNLRGMHRSISEGIEHHKKGDVSYIRSAAGSLHSVFGNLDSLGWKWWSHLSPDFENKFRRSLAGARDIASNIWWTTGGYWATDEILDEEITGPISETDLKRYLKPGEAP